MTDNTANFITISERAYRYIRQFTIKSVLDAMIELITNAIDAYNKTDISLRTIDIIFINPSIIKLRDNAIGLTSDGLQKCFLQIGTFTADDNSRGFFSRGAKDITALGNLTFNTIKDNKYSQCSLDTDAYGSVTIKDVDATDEIRRNIGILNGNGLEVIIELLPNYQNINVIDLSNNLTKIAVLRDIVSDSRNKITIKEIFATNIIFQKDIKYDYPIGKKILDLEYYVPNYTNSKARFVMYKSDEPIEQPVKENQMEFGFLIKDSTSIYEVNTIQDRFRWNPYVNYLYGYLYCEDIHQFLIDYDLNGTSEKNPYPIVDPSRITGLNKQHPFVINLLSIPAVRVDYALRELNQSVSSKMVSIEDLDDLIDQLQQFGIDLAQSKDIQLAFKPTYDQKLAKAIADERAEYVSYEAKYSLQQNYESVDTTIDKYVLSELQKLNPPSTYMYIVDPDNYNLYQIPNMTISNNVNESVNIMKLIPTDKQNIMKKNPYIYSLGQSKDIAQRQLEKLYIYDKGILDKSTDINELVNTNDKIFNIIFIDDINIQKRYIIDYTYGITVQINLHNPIVKKNLSISITDDKFTTSLSSMSSTKTVVFMKELITDIMSDIICESDVKSGKIILDADSFTNGKKILDYRNYIITQIEDGIDRLFDKLLESAKYKKLESVSSIINTISTYVASKINIDEDLSGMKDNLMTLLHNTVE